MIFIYLFSHFYLYTRHNLLSHVTPFMSHVTPLCRTSQVREPHEWAMVNDQKAVVKVDLKIPGKNDEKIALVKLNYTILGSGDIQVDYTFTKISDDLPEIPRIGMNMVLQGEFDRLQVFTIGQMALWHLASIGRQ
mgnify:CR=1 FL=1